MSEICHSKIGLDGIVLHVLVISEAEIASGKWGDPVKWIRTDPDTSGGVNAKGGRPLRKNYAGKGYKYDSELDAFIPPKPNFPSWIIDEPKAQWKAPKDMPQDGKKYQWDEATISWVLVVP